MYYKKICIMGARKVGKTSLIQRYLNGNFNTVYQTVPGTRIDKSIIDVDRDKVHLMLWDIQGEDQVSDGCLNYIKGASAIVYVVDGTRLETLPLALEYRRVVESHIGQSIPSIMLFNKSDLAAGWEISSSLISELEFDGIFALVTSCREGSGVGTAFDLITRVTMGKTALMPVMTLRQSLPDMDDHLQPRL